MGSGSLIINRQVFRFKGFDGAYDLQLVNSTKLKLKTLFFSSIYEFMNISTDEMSWAGLVVLTSPPRLKLWGDVKELPGLRSLHQVHGLAEAPPHLGLRPMEAIEVAEHRVITGNIGVKVQVVLHERKKYYSLFPISNYDKWFGTDKITNIH